jgi:Tol biopolymer transport system component/DNA-binding winged helix-turn-helix (wHTH) protein
MSNQVNYLYEFGPFRVDVADRLLLRDGEAVPLTPKAFETLLLLVESQGHTVEKDELMRRLWPDTFVEEANLTNNISLLRKALEESPNGHEYIKTVPRRGYRFVGDVNTVVAEDMVVASRDQAVESAASPAVTERGGKTRLFGNVPLAWPVAVAIAVVAALALGVAYFRRAPAGVEPMRVSISLPEKETTDGNTLSISPDGRRVAFIARSDGKTRLWVRPLGSFAARPLTGTEDAGQPFWSPDSQSIGFFGWSQDTPGGKLKKIDVSGGPTQVLCDARRGGGSWNRNGVILFGSENGGVQRVSAAGGEVTPVTALDRSRQEMSHLWPYFLPDGHHFLYLAAIAQQAGGEVYLASLDGKETKRLLAADTNAVYAPPGYLLFVRDGTLLAQRFDVALLELTGEPMRIAEQVQFNDWTHRGHFSVSENGVLVYYSGVEENSQLGWFDRTGKSLGLVGGGGGPRYASLSPDEKRVAFSLRDPQVGSYHLWLLDLVRGTNSRFTSDPANDFQAIWSPDGSSIVWGSSREGLRGNGPLETEPDKTRAAVALSPLSLYQKMTTGTGQDELLLKSSLVTVPTDWSADGRLIVYQQSGPKKKWDLWVLPLDGERKPSVFLQTEFNETDARFSPDVKWLAYTSDLSGSKEVYVQDFPAAGGKWTISTRGGSYPRWRRDGKELFYVSADQKLMAVEVKSSASFEPGAPKVLFDLRSVRRLGSNYDVVFFGDYNVTADGQRFLLRTSPHEAAPTQISVVLNWTADVKK